MKNWTGFVLALSLTVLVSLAAGQKASGNQTFGSPAMKGHPTSRQSRQLLSSLPLAAQAMISATLRRDDARYRVGTAHGGALSAQNPGNALGADFTLNGIQVRTGGAMQWGMTLRGYGYGDHLEQLREATPVSQGNRVEYRRGPLVEWYVNGPAGLEQGFTLAAPPGNHSALARRAEVGSAKPLPLTIALGLGGDLTATPESPVKGQPDARVEGLTLRDANGHAVLRYTGLNAHDAGGRVLVAW
jgi:trimeric autotransporter adhesin